MTGNSKLGKIIAPVLAAAVIIGVSVFTSFAAEKSFDLAQYTNSDTGFRVIISDDADLLTDDEEQKLIKDMAPNTEYGNVIFWSTEEYANDEIDQARQARLACCGYDSASIFAVNMKNRKLTIQSYGTMYKYVDDSKARSITDNASRFATNKEYYKCAEEVFSQIYTTVSGEKIAEPMKYASYVVISLMLGVIIALSVAFSKRFNPLRKPVERAQTVGNGVLVQGGVGVNLVRTETIIVETSSHSGGGFGGGGGSGSGSGCGGGGGGCGGGGSSSF